MLRLFPAFINLKRERWEKTVFVSQGKDEVYDRMLLDYFLSYHQFIHLLCRVAINCEKFNDTLVKLSTCRPCVRRCHVCVSDFNLNFPSEPTRRCVDGV